VNYEMENFKNRLQYIVTKVEGVPNLAKMSKVGASSIRGYLTGQNEPSFFKVVSMAKAGKVYSEWLASGEGPKDKEPNAPSAFRETPDLYVSTKKDTVDDVFLKSISYLKEIFDSQDQIFISAILANLHSFSRAIRREKESKQINLKNNELTDKIEKLDNNVNTLKDIIKGYMQPLKDGKERRKHLLQLLEEESKMEATGTEGL